MAHDDERGHHALAWLFLMSSLTTYDMMTEVRPLTDVCEKIPTRPKHGPPAMHLAA